MDTLCDAHDKRVNNATVLPGSRVSGKKGMVEIVQPSYGKKSTPCTLIKLNEEAADCPESIGQPICWIVPAGTARTHRFLEFMSSVKEIGPAADHKKRLLKESLSTAHFQVIHKWEGLGQRILRLHGVIPNGDVLVLVGEYTGVEKYTLDALQKARRKRDLTPVLHGLFGIHSTSMCMFSLDANPFSRMLISEVETVMSRQSLKLTSDQKRFIDFLCSRNGGCAAVDVVAGSGKSVTTTACEMAIMETEVKPTECIVHVVKTRQARHTQLKFDALDPCEVLELGRPLKASPHEDEVAEYGMDASLGSIQ